jgi:hypothetical protein
VVDHLDTARADVLAFTGLPKEIWRQIWSNKPQERLNREIRRSLCTQPTGAGRSRPVMAPPAPGHLVARGSEDVTD